MILSALGTKRRMSSENGERIYASFKGPQETFLLQRTAAYPALGGGGGLRHNGIEKENMMMILELNIHSAFFQLC